MSHKANLHQLLSAYEQHYEWFVASHTDALGRYRDSDDEADAKGMEGVIERARVALEAVDEMAAALRKLCRLNRGLEAWHEDATAEAWVRANAVFTDYLGERP